MRVKNALGICTIFTYQALMFGDDFARLYSAATGNEITASELIKAGERIFNLLKVINVREGFTRKEDKVPETWLRPMKSPEGKIEMMDYYEERGWDIEKGIPTKQKLQELSLEEYTHFLM